MTRAIEAARAIAGLIIIYFVVLPIAALAVASGYVAFRVGGSKA